MSAERKKNVLFCDESNHLMRNEAPMTLGYIMCEKSKIRQTNRDIRNLKIKHGLRPGTEIKWTKVSEKNLPFYDDLICYFYKNNHLKFRCIVADKSKLDHALFEQTHDDWYYKMYYLLLKEMLYPSSQYRIYLDKKDTKGPLKVALLHSILDKSYKNCPSSMIEGILETDSREHHLMQLCDLFIGGISSANHRSNKSAGKASVIKKLEKAYGSPLTVSTSRDMSKFNIFIWSPQ